MEFKSLETSLLGGYGGPHVNDIIIPILGPSGVGKSTFVNCLLNTNQREVPVGTLLHSCTSQLTPIALDSSQFPAMRRFGDSRRLIVVDTPGFDDTYVDDVDILGRISDWLAASYTADMKLGGVIYLHDISQSRVLGSTRKNINLFQKLIGRDALQYVTLGTTKWDLIREEVGLDRESQLKEKYWAEMINAGSIACRIQEGETSPIGVVNALLGRMDLQSEGTSFDDEMVLKIQDELVNLKKFVPETDVGKALKYNLQDIVKIQLAEVQRLSTQIRNSDDPKLREELKARRKLLENLQESQKMLHIPLAHRARRFLTQLKK